MARDRYKKSNENKFLSDYDIQKSSKALSNIDRMIQIFYSANYRNNFGARIELILEESGLAKWKFAECAGISENTLDQWRSDFKNEIEVNRIRLFQFCTGLHLPYDISKMLLDQKRILFYDNSIEDCVYRTILQKYYHHSKDEINEILRKNNLAKWW